MNQTMNIRRRAAFVTLCSACAIWATAAAPLRAASPGGGGHGAHGANNGFNNHGGCGSFGYGGYGGYGGFGWGGGLLGFELDGNENRIPYYALHPPVYYSYPIARPYGDSPFASPPGYYGPGSEDGGPQTVINPYAQPGSATPSNAAPSNAAPSNATPAPPAPGKGSPQTVKPTAGRTAALIEDASPTTETLPAPASISLPDVGSPASSNVHVVVNPYVR